MLIANAIMFCPPCYYFQDRRINFHRKMKNNVSGQLNTNLQFFCAPLVYLAVTIFQVSHIECVTIEEARDFVEDDVTRS